MQYSGQLKYTSLPLIQEALSYFKTPNLKVDAESFRAKIEDYKANKVEVHERHSDDANQNLHMVKFFWGHDHDFGDFQEGGLMGTRHLWMLSRMFDHFGVDVASVIEGKKILDVGSWTGGVSLALSQLGGDVDAIDEINKYVNCLNFVAKSFGAENVRAHELSLYELPTDWNEKFDTVCFFGVLYHLSDPIVGLRRLFHTLKPGGTLLLETMAIGSDQQVFEYEGPGKRNGQFGWNWFVPSPSALKQILIDTGFTDVQVGNGLDERVTQEGDPMGANRCFAVAKKDASHVICQAGLSVNID